MSVARPGRRHSSSSMASMPTLLCDMFLFHGDLFVFCFFLILRFLKFCFNFFFFFFFDFFDFINFFDFFDFFKKLQPEATTAGILCTTANIML